MDSIHDHSHTGDLHELVTAFDHDEPTAVPSWEFSDADPISSQRFDDSLDAVNAEQSSTLETPHAPASLANALLQRAEKEADDPTSSFEGRRPFARGISSSTPTTLTRLFAFNSAHSNSSSRNPSYNYKNADSPLKSTGKFSTLPVHLYTRGLLGGRHSDITIHAFGNAYALHRLILDRAPFFASAFSGPWLESSSKDVTLHPDDTDPNITPLSFELALKRLYGCNDPHEEESEAAALFATGCWLEMEDLIEASTKALLRTLQPETIATVLKLVEPNDYGKEGERILVAAKSLLFRDGWKMPIEYWDGISGDIAREIIGGDCFYVSREWDRWQLAESLLNRRLRSIATEAGLLDAFANAPTFPPALSTFRVTRTTTDDKKIPLDTEISENDQLWLDLYARPEIEPLLVLLDEDIHYTHLDFEQLQIIRSTQNIFGGPIVPEKVIADSLWTSMELRQKVLNAADKDLELGIGGIAKEEDSSGPKFDPSVAALSPNADDTILGAHKNQNAAKTTQPTSEVMLNFSQSRYANSKDGKERFRIPVIDRNIVIGGGEPIVSSYYDIRGNTSRTCPPTQLEDLQWSKPFKSPPPTSTTQPQSTELESLSYTKYPPYRFSVEFPDPRLMKSPGRMYSQTVFYAGSFWNLYVQKVGTSSKHAKVGVYLNRITEEEMMWGRTRLSQQSVDEKIGHLEREMLLRGERRGLSQRRSEVSSYGHELFSTGADSDAILNSHMHSSRPYTLDTTNLSRHSTLKASFGSMGHPDFPDDLSYSRDGKLDESTGRPPPVPPKGTTLPPYTDARPTVKTYFKIYIPSKRGRMLSVYESVPVKFNCQQSWGWTSSNLMLDEENLAGESTADEYMDRYFKEFEIGGKNPGGGDVDKDDASWPGETGRKKARDTKLRFTVVIGHV